MPKFIFIILIFFPFLKSIGYRYFLRFLIEEVLEGDLTSSKCSVSHWLYWINMYIYIERETERERGELSLERVGKTAKPFRGEQHPCLFEESLDVLLTLLTVVIRPGWWRWKWWPQPLPAWPLLSWKQRKLEEWLKGKDRKMPECLAFKKSPPQHCINWLPDLHVQTYGVNLSL